MPATAGTDPASGGQLLQRVLRGLLPPLLLIIAVLGSILGGLATPWTAYHVELPDVDLFIRTGGEQRVSNFLLWQIAYAEIFVDLRSKGTPIPTNDLWIAAIAKTYTLILVFFQGFVDEYHVYRGHPCPCTADRDVRGTHPSVRC